MSKVTLSMGEGSSKLSKDVSFKLCLVCSEAEVANGKGLTEEGPAAKDRGNVGACEVNFIPVTAKDKGACGGVAAEEGIADATAIAVGSTATCDIQGGVGALRTEVDNTVGVHGGEEGGEGT